jgi:hypothetical protein
MPPDHDTAAFRARRLLETWKKYQFRGPVPTAHPPVDLRIAARLPAMAQGRISDLPGSALIGWVSHPPDHKPNFRRHHPLLSLRTSLAWSLLGD